MRCHYEVLGISKDATNDEIKKAYRKQALQWHPDKNADNIEEANKRFLEIQDAYETLSDDQERAWYDSHREVLLNGGMDGGGTDAKIYLFNVYPYFTSSCFKGYGDDEKGFYAVYREVFKNIAEEDKDSYEEDIEIPEFGDSKSDYETIVATFYAFWQSYCSPRSFVWCEQHDTREANDRYVRRQMEKENKKLRDKAKKERNEEIRNLITFIRKKDKRVDEYKKVLEEKAKLAQKKTEERREAERQKRLEQMKNYVEPEWMRNTEKQLDELNINDNEELDTDENESNESEDDDFFCVACDKSFKSNKAFMNHEKSKKHKENLELLKKTMKEEDINLFFSNSNSDSKQADIEGNVEEEITNQNNQNNKNRLSKKQKKKNRQKSKDTFQDDDEEENDIYEPKEIIKEENNIEESINENSEEVIDKLKDENEKKEESNSATITPSICSVCKHEFDSRNKLFEHIKAEGHAAIKNGPKNEKKSKKKKGKN